jgi:hypothetical protein
MKKTVTVPKKKLLGALMMAKQAGAAQAGQQPPPGGPPMGAPTPPPSPMGGAPGMKKGGFVPFGKADDDGDEPAGKDGKKKWVPPWAKKKEGGVVKLASGGTVGGRGDGCAQRGKTRGRQV